VFGLDFPLLFKSHSAHCVFVIRTEHKWINLIFRVLFMPSKLLNYVHAMRAPRNIWELLGFVSIYFWKIQYLSYYNPVSITNCPWIHTDYKLWLKITTLGNNWHKFGTSNLFKSVEWG
jgi:hypothetical protein